MEIMGFDITQLSYGALFVWLLLDNNKKTDIREQKAQEREEKYQEIINTLADKISIVEKVEKDVEEIKGIVTRQEAKRNE